MWTVFARDNNTPSIRMGASGGGRTFTTASHAGVGGDGRYCSAARPPQRFCRSASCAAPLRFAMSRSP